MTVSSSPSTPLRSRSTRSSSRDEDTIPLSALVTHRPAGTPHSVDLTSSQPSTSSAASPASSRARASPLPAQLSSPARTPSLAPEDSPPAWLQPLMQQQQQFFQQMMGFMATVVNRPQAPSAQGQLPPHPLVSLPHHLLHGAAAQPTSLRRRSCSIRSPPRSTFPTSSSPRRLGVVSVVLPTGGRTGSGCCIPASNGGRRLRSTRSQPQGPQHPHAAAVRSHRPTAAIVGSGLVCSAAGQPPFVTPSPALAMSSASGSASALGPTYNFSSSTSALPSDDSALDTLFSLAAMPKGLRPSSMPSPTTHPVRLTPSRHAQRVG